jgi:hypothetical protein
MLAKDPKIAFLTINARTETVDRASSFREGFRKGDASSQPTEYSCSRSTSEALSLFAGICKKPQFTGPKNAQNNFPNHSKIVKRSRDDIARFLGWDVCSRLGEVPDAGGLRTPLDTGSSHRFPVRFQLQNETGLTCRLMLVQVSKLS